MGRPKKKRSLVKSDDVVSSIDNGSWRVIVDFPTWMVEEFDKEAKKLSVNRQAVIKTWLAEKIEAKRVLEAELGKAAGHE